MLQHHEAGTATFSAWRGTSRMVELPPFQGCLAASVAQAVRLTPHTARKQHELSRLNSWGGLQQLLGGAHLVLGMQAALPTDLSYRMRWGTLFSCHATICKTLCMSPGPSLLFYLLCISSLNKWEVQTGQPLFCLWHLQPAGDNTIPRWLQRLTAYRTAKNPFYSPSLFRSELIQPGALKAKHSFATQLPWGLCL